MYHSSTQIALTFYDIKKISDISNNEYLLLDDSSKEQILEKKYEKKVIYEIEINKSKQKLLVSEDYILKVKDSENKNINILLKDYIEYIENINSYEVLPYNINININQDNESHIDKYSKEDVINDESFYECKIEKKDDKSAKADNIDEGFVKIENGKNDIIDIIDKLNNKSFIYKMYKNYILYNSFHNFIENYILEPYLFGYWYSIYSNFQLNKYFNMINIINNTQLNYFKLHLHKYNLYLDKNNSVSNTYYIQNHTIPNILNIFVHKYNLHNNYSIPNVYKYASIEDRLLIISGLLDGSCYYNSIDDNNYYIHQIVNEKYHKNMCDILNSLGMFYYINNDEKKMYICINYQKQIGEILKFDNIINTSAFTIKKMYVDDCVDVLLKSKNKHILLSDYTII